MKILLIFLFSFLLIIKLNANETYDQDPRIQKFVKKISKKNNFSYSEIINLFNQVKKKSNQKELVIKKTLYPAEKTLHWESYYSQFVNAQRINHGVKFWQQYKDILNQAEEDFQVPAKIIVATIGIETLYGKNLGKYLVFPTLVWLAFDGKVRNKFYLTQLEYLLIIRNENNWLKKKFHQLKGSYSGAIGWGQFIPQSYKTFAIDYNLNGNKNLLNDLHDVIGSIANYYQKTEWKKKEKTATLLSSKPKSKKNILSIRYQGKKQYWRIYHNFKVIKRYNPSNYYALALFLLANKIEKKYLKKPSK